MGTHFFPIMGIIVGSLFFVGFVLILSQLRIKYALRFQGDKGELYSKSIEQTAEWLYIDRVRVLANETGQNPGSIIMEELRRGASIERAYKLRGVVLGDYIGKCTVSKKCYDYIDDAILKELSKGKIDIWRAMSFHNLTISNHVREGITKYINQRLK